MSFQAWLKDQIIGSGEVQNIIGTNCYQRPAPSTATFPLVTFFEVTGKKIWNSENWEKQYQVDCWAKDFPTARMLTDEVVKSLEGSSGSYPDVDVLGMYLRSEQELYDGALHHFALTWAVSMRTKKEQ